jgi:GNAT superfamily N-acetyltransferase
VRAVHSHADREQFVRFPWQIYADDPHWSPPLLLDRREFINPAKHPFYRHGAATALLAWRDGRPVGRILVSDDPHFNAHNNANAGCFGMFESEDDPVVAHALLDAAAAWLVDRGRTQMLGPIDYSTNYACGLLIDGFNTPPRVMMNHNPPYYQRLLESWGLAKEKDLYAWWFGGYEQIEAWRLRVERLAARHGVTVRHVRRSELATDLGDLLAIYNEAWKDNWGHVPMTDAEFKYMAGQLVHIAIPELLLVAEVDGQPVGCSMTLPDFNEATGPLNGRLFRFGLPIGAWKLWRGLKRIKTARLLALGVLKEFRRRGIAELLILRTFDYGHNVQGYRCAELGWTLEDNSLINHTIAAVGGYRYKTYRIFSCALNHDAAG